MATDRPVGPRPRSAHRALPAQRIRRALARCYPRARDRRDEHSACRWPTTGAFSSALDVGQAIVVIGQTLDHTEVSQVVITNGQNKVTLETPLYRLYRMINVSSTDITGTLYGYVDGTITGGVPDDQTTVRAVIDNGDNQTQMAIYTVPKDTIGYVIGADVTFSRAVSAGAVGQFIFRIRTPGTVFRVLKRLALLSTGSSTWALQPPIPLGPLPAGTDMTLTVEAVSANNTGCSGSFTLLLERSIPANGGQI